MEPTTPAPPPKRTVHLFWLLAISYALFGAALNWSMLFEPEPLANVAFNGFFFTLIASVFWLAIILPASLLIWALYRWRVWERFRSLAIVSPAALFFIGTAVIQVANPPPDKTERLQALLGTPVPPTVHDIRCQIVTNGFDSTDETFYFRCRPADVDEIVRLLKLSPGSPRQGVAPDHPPPGSRSWPDPAAWKPGMLYQREDVNDGSDPDMRLGVDYALRTDADREQVYLYVERF